MNHYHVWTLSRTERGLAYVPESRAWRSRQAAHDWAKRHHQEKQFLVRRCEVVADECPCRPDNVSLLTDLNEIEQRSRTASTVALVCQGTDHAEVCAVRPSDAARLVDWVRNGNPSTDPGIGRTVQILEDQPPPQLVAYAVSDSHVTLSVVGATFDSQAKLQDT